MSYTSWKTRDGREIPIDKMTTSHLMATIHLLERYAAHELCAALIFANGKYEDDVAAICESKVTDSRAWIAVMEEELKKRKKS